MSDELNIKNSYLEEELKRRKNLNEDDNSEDDDQDYRKKDEEQKEQDSQKTEEVKSEEEVQGIIQKLKKIIFPKTNKVRNLDLETGGLETKSDDGKREDDLWDKRVEEIDDMQVDRFNTSGMKSVVWKEKKKRLNLKKELIKDAAIVASAKGSGSSFTAKVQKSRENGGNNNGISL